MTFGGSVILHSTTKSLGNTLLYLKKPKSAHYLFLGKLFHCEDRLNNRQRGFYLRLDNNLCAQILHSLLMVMFMHPTDD